jgi:dienelactone hydrolase
MNRKMLSMAIIVLVSGRAAAQPPDKPIEPSPAGLKNVLDADAPERKLRQAELKSLRDAVNRKDREEWARITSRETWEKYRDAILSRLQESLGRFPEAPKQVKVLTTKKIEGDGFFVENIVYESRPGLVVTANLYVPAKPPGPMPGMVIVPSHHNPKTQGELQDMGMTWARAGCLVLVPDMLGHGERRQHPFPNDKSYPHPFKVGRQDYYFRYNVAAQLHLAGESLMGWMVWDLMRGIDVLLARPGIDKNKIVVLGSVAGGGDPAAVLAALDRRVAAAAIFNFGGPQPETKFPLPDNSEVSFNYMGGGSWESTRNLRLSGRDGFLPWLLDAAIAPRGLIYAHEFAWDEQRDPAWKRLQTIYGFYGAPDRLASVHGRGSVQGTPPESTHCNNIGPEHRKGIHAALAKWFAIDAVEYKNRLMSADLQCMTDEAKETFKPQPVWALARAIGEQRLTAARAQRAELPESKRHGRLQKQWASLLGVEMLHGAKVETVADAPWLHEHRYKTLLVRSPQNASIAIPVQLVVPKTPMAGKPVVVAISQGGKRGFLKHRSEIISRLLSAGIAVCMPDLRGTGEMRTTGTGRGRTSSDTSVSSTEWMHGRTVLGTQVQELLLVLDTLPELGLGPAALWGDSFAPVNSAETTLAVPYDADGSQPSLGEPMGGLVAQLGGLFAPAGTVRAIHVRGSLSSYRSALATPFFYVPHDALVPEVLTVSDIDDVTAAWAPRPLRIEAPIDGHNQLIGQKAFATEFALTRAAYPGGVVELRESPAAAMADWFAAHLRKGKTP